MGSIAWIDLNTMEIKINQCVEKIYRDYLGGVGIGVYYLFKTMRAEIDPLGKENFIGFVPGLLTGSGFPFSTRMTVVSKSPLTNTWGDSNMGGYFGTELRKAGYAALFISGRAKTPVYIIVDEEQVEIRDADHLWGYDTQNTQEKVKNEIGYKFQIACIGQAGENLLKIACIIHDKGRAAGRSGLGAVMGSKNLKAIAVRGQKSLKPVLPKEFNEIIKRANLPFLKKGWRITEWMRQIIDPIMPWIARKGIVTTPDYGSLIKYWREYGTTMLSDFYVEMGNSPVKNWKGVGSIDFPMKTRSSKISGEVLRGMECTKTACRTCPTPCGALIDGTFVGLDHNPRKPENEAVASFGSMLLNDDIISIIKSNDVCDKYGIDVISTGGTIAFAMECFEQGLIRQEDCGSLELEWGKTRVIETIIDKMIKRDGIGAILADGVQEAVKKLGDQTSEYAIHVKGQELPMYDPRLNPSYATTYVCDPTPGRHTQGTAGMLEFGISIHPVTGLKLKSLPKYKYDKKGEIQATLTKLWIAMNSVGMCNFSIPFGPLPVIEAIRAFTGWEYSLEEFLISGERTQCLRQSFNVREGLRPSDFQLPKRVIGIPPLRHGPTKGVVIDIDTLQREYYLAMSWDPESGIPHRSRLNELELDFVNN